MNQVLSVYFIFIFFQTYFTNKKYFRLIFALFLHHHQLFPLPPTSSPSTISPSTHLITINYFSFHPPHHHQLFLLPSTPSPSTISLSTHLITINYFSFHPPHHHQLFLLPPTSSPSTISPSIHPITINYFPFYPLHQHQLVLLLPTPSPSASSHATHSITINYFISCFCLYLTNKPLWQFFMPWEYFLRKVFLFFASTACSRSKIIRAFCGFVIAVLCFF